MKHWTGLLALALLAPQHPLPIADIAVVGYVDLRPDHAAFGAKAPPVLSLRGASPLVAYWEAGTSTTLKLTRQAERNGRVLVWLQGDPPEGPGRLVLVHTLGIWRIDATWMPQPGDLPVIAQAVGQHPPKEAVARLTEVLPTLPEHQRGPAYNVLAMLHARQGQLAEAASAFADAGRATAGHQTLLAAELWRASAFFHLTRFDIEAAGMAIEAARALVGVRSDPKGTLQTAYLQARIEEARARYSSAASIAATAMEAAWAIGDDTMYQATLEMQAWLLTFLGRPTAALAILDGQPPLSDPEAQWSRQVNRAWTELMAVRACALDLSPESIAPQLVVLGSTPAQVSNYVRTQAWLSAAEAHLLAGQGSEAERAVHEAKRLMPQGLGPQGEDLLARALVLQGKLPEAERIYAELLDQLLVNTGSDHRWRALHGLGQVAFARGDRAKALKLWRGAAADVVQTGRLNWLRSDRSTLVADRREPLIDLINLLVAQGQLTEALQAAVRHDAPVLAALAREARLESLDPTQLARWNVLVTQREVARRATEAQVETCRTSPTDAARLCQEALERIAHAQVLTEQQLFEFIEENAEPALDVTLPTGEAVLVFLTARTGCKPGHHRLLLRDGRVVRVPDGEDVIDHLVGVSHLHLVGPQVEVDQVTKVLLNTPGGPTVGTVPALSWLARAPLPQGNRVVVVADPKNDLPHARKAPDRVRGEALVGDEATRTAVLDRLDGTHLLHYEGHGDLSPGDPWNAHLQLSDGNLTAADLLARRPRLGLALLIGCKTGSAARLSRTESLGLADAFLLAGADRVIAPDRDVPDAEAAKFVERFYAHGGRERPAQAFRATVIELGPAGQGWRYFGRP